MVFFIILTYHFFFYCIFAISHFSHFRILTRSHVQIFRIFVFSQTGILAFSHCPFSNFHIFTFLQVRNSQCRILAFWYFGIIKFSHYRILDIWHLGILALWHIRIFPISHCRWHFQIIGFCIVDFSNSDFSISSEFPFILFNKFSISKSQF